ncbi:MAG: hypothetical protein ACRDJC_16815 [Thermomicrobiales bacterium]
MENARFDRLTKIVGRHVTRRSALGPLAGLGLAGLSAATAETDAKQRRRRKRQRQRGRASAGARWFDELAETLTQASGDCDALLAAAEQFREQNDARIDLLRAEEAGWTRAERSERARRDQDRITAATERLHTLLATCGFRGTTPALDSLLCGLTPGGDEDPPGQASCQEGCDCGCICPISAGECTLSFFGCLGGSEASCCWFGACAGHQCSEQCPNCCNCNVNCCGC